MVIALGLSIYFYFTVETVFLLHFIGLLIIIILVIALINNDNKTLKTYGYILSILWIGIDLFYLV